MKIMLPKIGDKIQYIEDRNSIVLVGANGAGKTRMSVWIEENNKNINVHRISAQKSLNMPASVKISEISSSFEKLKYGLNSDDKQWLDDNGKRGYRWGGAPAIHMLDDFESLMEYLMTEYSDISIEYRTEHKAGNTSFDKKTKLDIICKIWQNVIEHRKLKISTGKVEVFPIGKDKEKYNGKEMSDGERAIFYFIAEVMCADDNSLIIIDEPENHLHKSILVKLWNAIEKAKTNCMFLYITHDLDFAVSRENSQLVWVKSMDKIDEWTYELIGDNDNIPNAVYLEILGSRQKVLLVEGEFNSIDKRLYSKIYPEYNIIPVHSCYKVIEITKSYNASGNLHYKEVVGIIDRDRRSENELQALKNSKIYSPDVAEVENLFLLEDVIRAVSLKLKMDNEINTIIETVKKGVFKYLKDNIECQALLFTKQEYKNIINTIQNKKSNSLTEYQNNINQIPNNYRIQELYTQYENELQSIWKRQDYLMALKLINGKDLIDHSGILGAFKFKKKGYIEFVLSILDDDNKNNRDENDSNVSQNLLEALRQHMSLN